MDSRDSREIDSREREMDSRARVTGMVSICKEGFKRESVCGIRELSDVISICKDRDSRGRERGSGFRERRRRLFWW